MDIKHVQTNPSQEQMAMKERVSISFYEEQQNELKSRHQKILSKLKKIKVDAEFIEILRCFFCLEDETGKKENEGPSLHLCTYMETLTTELDELVRQKEISDINLALLEVLIRFNFNKEIVYKYFRDKLRSELKKHKGEEPELLRRWLVECESTGVRKDMAYDPNCLDLSYDMINEVRKQKRIFLIDNEILYPLQFKEHASVYCIIISMFIRIQAILVPIDNTTIHRTIQKATRGPRNKEYELGSIRTYFTKPTLASIKEAKLLLKRALDELEKFEDEQGR